VSPQTAQRCFQKAGLSTNESTYNKIDESNTKKLQESLDQAMYKNVTVEDYLNFNTEIEIEADVKEIEKFNDSHQHSKEDDDLIPKNLSANLGHTMMLYTASESFRNFCYITILPNF
jgi:hypothetical protein